eukprot:CAMPEP_0170156034 /NCGR_PEP_ID=MMETSP0033_2-20121228/62158_1 /TAXON_ID=195969 /ORGANISM="Dolichomastix tenuilepis, Strain CCMP3274" /LENGTH=106 /DNA_ID=CAMNT_0010393375 /DNA_START=279 /DNA_END=599 /DNA_ORIENTATION=-
MPARNCLAVTDRRSGADASYKALRKPRVASATGPDTTSAPPPTSPSVLGSHSEKLKCPPHPAPVAPSRAHGNDINVARNPLFCASSFTPFLKVAWASPAAIPRCGA